jgi:aryl-alcohol dehydrogenase-like predicted oxidoreductase
MVRSDAVIATKLGLAMGDGPNQKGLSRKHVMEAVDASLKRLKTDYIDLLYIHRLDVDTSLEEMAEALNDVVRAGKAVYLGASSMWAWQFAKIREMQRANGWAQFVVMQNFYNLCYREEEREMIPYCQAEGVALVPWSPMARGFLAGNRPQSGAGATSRGQTDKLSQGYFGTKRDYVILARVEALASKLGVKPAQIALAWVLAKGVTAPIVGATKKHHLDDAIAALDVKLTQGQIASLEKPYLPRSVMGHQ